MRVEDLMTRKIQSCRPDDTLDRVAQLMWDYDCGCMPVCAPSGNGANHTIGMITDRDICMHALFQGKALRELHVGDAMTKEVRSCRQGDSLSQAERIMSEGRIRRLPVVDDGGGLVGMISLADLAREAARELGTSRKDVTEAEIGDTLAMITQPAAQVRAA